MRILAIETATEACSVALFEDGVVLDSRHEILGRGHAERLVPMIAELPGKGRAQEIRVSLGPGSFTGTRIGLAAARALGIAWTAKVRGYPTPALVAAMARAGQPRAVTVCMVGGHGEWFVQDFGEDGMANGELASVTPREASMRAHSRLVAGSRARELAELGDGPCTVFDLLPDAQQVLALPEALLTDRLSPLYGRPPDARLPG